MQRRIHIFMCCCLQVILISSLQAQDKVPFKFGKINITDFGQKAPAFDTAAQAVVIADIGITTIEPNNDGGFGYEFNRKMRVKILDKNGVDAGKFAVSLYQPTSGGGKEEIVTLKATTYNLEGGKIVETDLEKKDVFSERYSKYRVIKKFSLPALKEGSIFEINYTIKSAYRDVPSWSFQRRDYPILWSEYEIEVPDFFDYVYLAQGYHPFHISTSKEASRTYHIRGGESSLATGPARDFSVSGMAIQKRWVIKDAPSLKEESFTTTVDNHITKIEFQLSAIRYPQQAPILVMENWPKIYEEFMKNDDFGVQLDRISGSLDNILQPLVAGAATPLERAQRIYKYVRDNYTCVERAGLVTKTGLKPLLKTKSGNVVDLNLLLTAMLKAQNVDAYPVIMSTREHGVTHQIYPLIDRFNYVICLATIDGADYLLDASSENLAFGKLDIMCYNGHARVLTSNPEPIFLSTDSLLERKVSMAILAGQENKIVGTMHKNYGYYESVQERNRIKKIGEAAFFDAVKTNYGSDFSITNTQIDSLKKPEEPIKVAFDLSFAMGEEDIIYFNPVLEPFYKENPFKSAARHYPIEMPYRVDETYILNFELPKGFEVDEMPKSTKVSFNEGDGYFEYLISGSGGRLQLRSRVVLNRANFNADEYVNLREFFGYVIKKQQEQVVLKKKSS